MTEAEFNQFLGGALVMSSLGAAAYFLRFYRDTHDRLFLAFAAAFFLLGVNWLTLAIVNSANEARPLLYILRLMAFTVIIWGIWDKNRQAARRSPPPPSRTIFPTSPPPSSTAPIPPPPAPQNHT